MEEAGTSTPENGGESFDLKTSDANGRSRGIVLEGAGLAWTSGAGPQRRALDDIASITLEAVIGGDDDFARCDLRFVDNTDLAVQVDDPGAGDDSGVYRNFVLGLFERLGSARRARIVFRHGHRASTRAQWVIADIFAIAVFLGLFALTALSPELHTESGLWVLLPVELLAVGGFAWLARHHLRSGPRSFDPESIPQRALPPAPRPRKPK